VLGGCAGHLPGVAWARAGALYARRRAGRHDRRSSMCLACATRAWPAHSH